jgi:hypothetical protein
MPHTTTNLTNPANTRYMFRAFWPYSGIKCMLFKSRKASRSSEKLTRPHTNNNFSSSILKMIEKLLQKRWYQHTKDGVPRQVY